MTTANPKRLEVEIHLPQPHAKQIEFIRSPAKRKVVRAGRRGGKTVGMGIHAVESFLAGHRVLYAAPTSEQISRFWATVTQALAPAIDKKVFYKNETEHIIEKKGTENRLKAKAQPFTSKIYTPDGYKSMGDIKIGDDVLTPFGSVTKVTGVYPQGECDIYKITFGDGCSCECTEDHLWEVKNLKDSVNYRNNYVVVATDRLLSHNKINCESFAHISHRPRIRISSPAAFSEKTVPIDPYLLGVLLGDGNLLENQSPKISTVDTEILNRIKGSLPVPVEIHHDKGCDYRLSAKGKPVKHGNPLIASLKKLGLVGKKSHEKFIPDCYKYNSAQVRLSVLRGLMDTDGTVSKQGKPVITQTSKRLAGDIAEVVQSLGGLCSISKHPSGYKTEENKYVKCRDVYRQYILMENHSELFSLPRKKTKLSNKNQFSCSVINRNITSIKKVRKAEAQCIRVADERHLYLTDNFIVTHNTAWNADSLRGDYADELILDEWQLMNEDAWGLIGAPMLLDNNGNATFVYTPPSLHSRSVSKADDPQHAAKLFKKAKELSKTQPDRWATFHFSSMDNPHISREALDEISSDMTTLAYRMEILAEDIDEAPGALWTRKTLDDNRVRVASELSKIVVAVDPSVSTNGDSAGIIVAGKFGEHGYVLEDCTIQGSPLAWARAAVDAYHRHEANLIVAEKNQGGEMVELTIRQADKDVPIRLVHASRGKIVRAEPVAAKYEKGLIHHVGSFPLLEDELCLYLPGDPSPNRLDACFVGGTMVETKTGPMPIEKIKAGAEVLTRKGFRRVVKAGYTGERKVYDLMLSCGIILTGTGNHPVYTTERGFVKICDLMTSDTLSTLQEAKKSTMEAVTFVTRGRDTSSLQINGQGATTYTAKSGLTSMVKFLLDTMSTIKMEISSIMTTATMNCSQKKNMHLGIKNHIESKGDSTLIQSDIFQLNGTGRLLGVNGTLNMGRKVGRIVRGLKRYVQSVVKNISIWLTERLIGFAPAVAYLGSMSEHIDIGKTGYVSFAEPTFLSRKAKSNEHAPVHVVSRRESVSKSVYNLEVADVHEYYANGILVHNCVWAMTDLMTESVFDDCVFKDYPDD